MLSFLLVIIMVNNYYHLIIPMITVPFDFRSGESICQQQIFLLSVGGVVVGILAKKSVLVALCTVKYNRLTAEFIQVV